MVRNPEALHSRTNTETQNSDTFAQAVATTAARERKSAPSETKRKLHLGLRPLNALVLLGVALGLFPGAKASAQEINTEVNNVLDNPIALVSGGWNINHDRDALNDAARLLALNSDLIETAQDDDEPTTSGGDDPRIEGDNTPEIIDAFDGDLAAFALESGDFPEVDEIFETILETVDAELLQNKQISFEDLTVTNGELVDAEGTPFEIPDEATQDMLLQLIENLPDGSKVSVNFIVDNLTVDDEGNISVVLGMTVTYTSEIPTEAGENLRRTDITYVDGDDMIQVFEGTPVPNGVKTNFTLTTAGEISSALAASGITLDAEDFETVLVETMTRTNGGTPQEIIIRVIHGDLTGEPEVILPTSAEITVPINVNIRSENNTSGEPLFSTETNTLTVPGATFAHFPPTANLEGLFIDPSGVITYEDTRNSLTWRAIVVDGNLAWAAYSNVTNPATGTPMPNVSVENTGPVASPTLQPEAEPAPEPDLTDGPDADETPPPPAGGEGGGEVPAVVVTPEYMGLSGENWNITYPTPEGPRNLTVNPETAVHIGPENTPMPLGVFSIDEIREWGVADAFADEVEDFMKYYSWDDLNMDNTRLVSAIFLDYHPSGRALIRTIDVSGNEIDISIQLGSSYMVALDENGVLESTFLQSGQMRNPSMTSDGFAEPQYNPYRLRRGDIFIAIVAVADGLAPGSEFLELGDNESFQQYLTTRIHANPFHWDMPYTGTPNSSITQAIILNSSTAR